MLFPPQIKVPATYMRGGTSKGVFFNLNELPTEAQQPGPRRDALLLRVIGSPDPYGKQTDGMGGATSSTSKAVIVSSSREADHDVDYLFAQVAIDRAFVDWSGNCGNLTGAVGAFAITQGLVAPERINPNGITQVRIWQANIEKTIIAHVPMYQGQVQETGDFELDGVTFPSAEVKIDFISPASGTLLPTGHVIDNLIIPELGSFEVSYISAGIPTAFFNAEALGFNGSELQEDINNNDALLAKLELIRAHAAVAMGLIDHIKDAEQRQHTPKLAFCAPPKRYTTSSGKTVERNEIDLQVRAMSMGKLHHAMMGTAAVAISAASAIPGTLINLAAGGGERSEICFGHPSGTLKVGGVAKQVNGQWQIKHASMSRSARVLMSGWVHLPAL